MTRLELQPSRFDRLDPAARAVRWWTSQMLDIIGAPRRKVVAVEDLSEDAERLSGHVAIMLPEEDGFQAEMSLAKGNADIHRQALALRLPDIAPLPVEQLCVAARAVAPVEGGAVTYAVAMARRARLDELEAIARRRGARSVAFRTSDSDDVDIVSPKTQKRRRNALIVDAAIVAALAIAAVAASMMWTTRIALDTETLAQQERDLRGAAIATETAREEVEVARTLVERGILNRRSTVTLDAIAALNQATPRQAWWTRLVWTPAETTIAGEAIDATAAIGALSTTAKGWSIELAGPIAAAPEGGGQSFTLVARPRKGAPP